ncbi:WecB/TagA/CpsF family glycosyltransferase [Nesterenkonia populi]|uniref:WecB/TagA/CpsF family glycosyltransferase n=1 Tax=Nesterenkonia populi TaxID=1591087 RepID=UPI0011BDEB57|nr:WecB/TagA/CpsF family glycosyltransferase [Nesterenkonia populi]
MADVKTVEVKPLGLTVTPMTAEETVEWVTKHSGKGLLLNHNLHSAYLYQKSQVFRDFYARANRVVIDGAPILWLARRTPLRRIGPTHRIGSTDWIACLDKAPLPGRLFVFGAEEVSNCDAVSTLRQTLSHSGWHVEGRDGYISWAEAVEWLQSGKPTLVLVGLGMPMQEEFLTEAWDELPEAVYATVGGAIDYMAGHNPLAPRWMGRFGVEWLWRLVHDPRRLAHRYLVEPFKLGWSLMRNGRSRSATAQSPTPEYK